MFTFYYKKEKKKSGGFLWLPGILFQFFPSKRAYDGRVVAFGITVRNLLIFFVRMLEEALLFLKSEHRG